MIKTRMVNNNKDSEKILINRFEHNKFSLDNGFRLIEASAGTGKTFALAHLVLRLITEKEYLIHQILVITFTEAAASELKQRICNRLELALNGLTKSKHENNNLDFILRDWINKNTKNRVHYVKSILLALESLERADITTIHGFCKRTLERCALESRSSVKIKIETNNKQLAYEICHSYWRQHIIELNPGNLRGLQDSGFNIDNILKNLLLLDSDRSLILPNYPDGFNIKQNLENQLNLFLNQKWSEFVKSWILKGKSLDNKLKDLAKELRANGISDTKPFSTKPSKDRFQLVNDWIKSYKKKNCQGDLFNTPNYSEIKSQKELEQYFHPSVVNKLLQKHNLISKGIEVDELQLTLAALWDEPAEKAWVHALLWTQKELSITRKQNGLMSYGDLLKEVDPMPIERKKEKRQTKSILKDSLGERYKAVLVDEFQDTDPIQWRIIDNTFCNTNSHLLIVVGDPKQAIYRFRGGSLHTYFKAKSKVDSVNKLIDNYRTTASLMRALNQLLSIGLKRSSLEVEHLNPQINEKALADEVSQPPLKIIDLDFTLRRYNEDSTQFSKSQLEALIPKFATNEVIKILEASDGKLDPSDICILVNRHDQANIIREHLTIGGIPSKLVNQGDILCTEGSLILQRFLDCLANPWDTTSIHLVASSPLIQWDIQKLKDADSDGSLNRLSANFLEWSKKFEKIGLINCLNELLKGEKIADLTKRGRLLAEITQCAQIVEEQIHSQALDINNAARWLRQQRLQPVAEITEERLPHSDISNSSVNVLTIHRSKGLEFKVVICPYLWQEPPIPIGPLWRSEESQHWKLRLNNQYGEGNQLFKDSKESALQEAERLAYVAFTRARSKLIIFWAKIAKQEGNPLNNFLFGSQETTKGNKDYSPEKIKSWFKSNNIQACIESDIDYKFIKQWRLPETSYKYSLGPIPERHLDHFWGRKSFSSWCSKPKVSNKYNHENIIDLKNDEGEEVINIQYNSSNSQETFLENGPLSEFPRGILAGNCLHKILERIDFSKTMQDDESVKIIKEETFN